MKRQSNTQQVKEHEKCPPNQTKEEEIGNLLEKEFQIMIMKMIQNLESKMELQINSLETKIEKMQEMFNKDLEEIKKRQLKINNAINEIKMELQINSLETRIEKIQEIFNKDLEEIKKSQFKMNNAINEIKNTLEGTNNRITEAEDRISEVEDKMVEINEVQRKKEKRIKRNEDNLRDLWNSVRHPNS